MKGFLSLLGITLIVGAFGLILLSYSGNPLEEMKSQERMYAYTETRQNHPIEETAAGETAAAPLKAATANMDYPYHNFVESCGKPSPSVKKAGSD